MQYPANELGILAAYMHAYEGEPLVLNQGLVAGENLRGLGAVQPATWFSLAKAQEAVRTKKDLTLQDVSGGRVIALGTAQTIGGKRFAPGDQVFYQPVTKTVQAVKTYKALQAESSRPSPTPTARSTVSSPPALSPVKAKAKAKAPAAKPAAVKAKVPAPKPASKAKPTEPSKAGMSKANVGQIQDILIKLGAKLKRDGLWGPATAAQWVSSAKRRKLDGTINRAGPMDAWIVQPAFDELARIAGVKGAAPQGQPVSAKTEPAKPSLTPGGAPMSRLEPITAAQLQAVFKAFNKSPKKAPEIQAAWVEVAKANKLDGTSSITKQGLEVVPKTRDELVKKAARRIDAAKMIAASKMLISVKTLQQAMKFANQTPTYSGRLSGVGVTGTWDGKTEDAFFVYFNIPAENISTWELALKTLVTKNKSLVKLPPNFATQANKDAANLSKVKKTVAKAEAAQKKAATAAKKEAQVVDVDIAANAARANTLVSVFTLQQALSEIRERQSAGAVPGPLLPGIKLTGKWDANTDKALYASFSDAMWGGQTIPKGAWPKLLNRVLVKSQSKGVAGLYGVFGDLAAAPTGANFIRLPAATAQKIQALAADFVARSAKSGAMTESREAEAEAALPAAGRVAGEPILITGRAPFAPAPAPMPAPIPITGEQMQVPMIESDGERVDLAPAPMPAPTPAPVFIPQPSAAAAAMAPIAMPSEEQSFAPPAAAEPTAIAPPTMPAAETKPESSNTLGIALAVVAGASAAYLLFAGEKEHRQQQRATNRSKRK
jgi:hypothetical protein